MWEMAWSVLAMGRDEARGQTKIPRICGWSLKMMRCGRRFPWKTTDGIRGSMNHHRIFIWCNNICICVSYTFFYILQYSLLVSHPLLNWTLSYPQHSLLHPFSVYQIHPKLQNSDAPGRRMWQQTSLASMCCWAWELLGIVANCAWKRCCLGEKGKGWSN